MQLDTAQLAALAAVVSTGSFELAAAQLGVTPSAISQRIKALENRVGTSLVIRAIPCRATPEGVLLARHASDVALLEGKLMADIGQSAPPARLRIAVNADSLAVWFLPALVGFDYLFDIVIDDQAHSADWLRRGEVVAAITDHTARVQGCAATPLGAIRYKATCTPTYQARYFPHGVTADALAVAPMLQFNEKDSLQHQWMLAATGQKLAPPVLRLPTSRGFLEAARLGLGWGLNPEVLARDDLAAGRLVALPEAAPFTTPLVWQVRQLTSAPLAALTRAVKRAAAVLSQE